jgi:gamma-glutamyl phosphate reductase
VSSELKDLKSDVAELNQLLKRAERQSVKEVLLMEVNTVSAKIKSLCETVSEQTSNEAKWSDVVAGKHKKVAYGRQEKIYPIPVIKNCYELLCSIDVCEILVCKSTGNQEVGKHCKKKISSKRRKHKIIIMGTVTEETVHPK